MSIMNKLKTFFTMDEEDMYADEEMDTGTPGNGAGQNSQRHNRENVVNLTSIQQPASKVVLYEPRNYNEAQEIADNVVNKRAAVINLQRIDQQQAKRIVDFLSGTVYAVNGDIQKLGDQTFLCTPENVDVSGSITDTLVEEDEFHKGW
ncbi:cell division protein SepF [Lentibacillus juripiscarius]|uniref:Cell division protein SepF n=1 Tax=Lentibacillus juripiscarius TaxID=257446 RepID=A0ABW5V3F9_9BACI